ncbi:MAG: hypothetical protein LBU70_10040 [Chitinispirillales bacterium]|jgi:hypothetical protein|nr:hypothetical protein [Chitinispirillales bacterium]
MRRAIAGAVAGLVLGAFSLVSAVELSAGFDGGFTSDFGAGLFGVSGKEDGIDFAIKTPWNGSWFNVFLDATYAELGIGLIFGSGEEQMFLDGKKEEDYWISSTISFAALNLSLVGKYPIILDNSVTVSPLAGIEYMMVLSATAKVGNYEAKFDGKDGAPKAGDLSRFGLKIGANTDIAINENVFLRSVLAYNIRFANKFSKDAIDDMYWLDYDDDSSAKATMGHGLTVSVGLGFRF